MIKKEFFWFLLIFNFSVFVVAFGSYLDEFKKINPLIWPFIPISAIYFGLMGLCIIIMLLKKKIPSPLAIFTFIGCVSYGFVSIFLYPIFMFSNGFSIYYTLALITHAALGIEAFLLLKYFQNLNFIQYTLIASYYGISDYFNSKPDINYYFSGLIAHSAVKFTITITILLHIILIISIFIFNKKKSSQKITKF